MANQNALGQTNGTDLHVVTPANIGKGIKWDPASKKYVVSVAEDQPITVNNNGELEVRVSNLENNLLRVVDGKLYYGTKARPELANLYVDAENGVDQNPLQVKGAGTQSNPLRTLSYAINLSEENTNRTIFLHEDQEHICSAKNGCFVKSGRCSIVPYGPIFTEISKTVADVSVAQHTLTERNKEPTIVFKDYTTWVSNTKTSSGYKFRCMTVEDCILYFQGVSLMNDVNMDLSPITGTTSIKEFARIITNRSLISGIRHKIKARGTLTGNISDVLYKNGLAVCGFFQGIETNFNVYNQINNIENDCPCFILAHHGWGYASDTSTSINALANDGVNQRAIAKRCAVVIKDGNLVKVPNTSIKSEFFV